MPIFANRLSYILVVDLPKVNIRGLVYDGNPSHVVYL